MVYINEGITVLFSMGYGFFKFFKEELIYSKDLQQVKYKIKKRAEGLSEDETTMLMNVILIFDLSYFTGRASGV